MAITSDRRGRARRRHIGTVRAAAALACLTLAAACDGSVRRASAQSGPDAGAATGPIALTPRTETIVWQTVKVPCAMIGGPAPVWPGLDLRRLRAVHVFYCVSGVCGPAFVGGEGGVPEALSVADGHAPGVVWWTPLPENEPEPSAPQWLWGSCSSGWPPTAYLQITVGLAAP